MGQHKRLTERQREFARLLVFNKGLMSNTQCAIEAGYSEKRARQEASELQKNFLVADYIEKLRQNMFEDNKLAINRILEEFYYLLQDARKKLGEDYKKGNYRRVVVTVNKFKEVFEYIGYGRSEITVYLAEETRPYKTCHYKIGKTQSSLEYRATGRTDNPFGLNYIASFSYIPSNGFNLEKTPAPCATGLSMLPALNPENNKGKNCTAYFWRPLASLGAKGLPTVLIACGSFIPSMIPSLIGPPDLNIGLFNGFISFRIVYQRYQQDL